MKKAFWVLWMFLLLASTEPSSAQKPPEGIWQGYDGELRHVSSQLTALAQATGQLIAYARMTGVAPPWTNQ